MYKIHPYPECHHPGSLFPTGQGVKREHICLNQGQGQYLRELWRGQDGPHRSGGSPPSPPLLPLAWVGGQWVAPGHWQGSPGELIAHLPHALNTRVTRDVWQLQLGQLLLQDRDPLLMGCRDTGRASLPPLLQEHTSGTQQKNQRKHPGDALAAFHLPRLALK